MKKLALFSKVPVLVLSFVLLSYATVISADDVYVTYKINDRIFKLNDVTLEYNVTENFISLRAESMETIQISTEEGEEEIDMSLGFSLEIIVNPKSIEGKYEESTSEKMPVSFWWYDKSGERDEYYISMESGDESTRKFTITIDKFGGEGTLVKGSFHGVLHDESGKAYKISDGKFCAKRVDLE
jgi:hypothetical protein